MAQRSDTKYWIGCVDDDAPFLQSAGQLIDRTLREHPFEVPCGVELATGASQFAEVTGEMQAEGAELALLITDQIMPGCSGLELVERIKTDNPFTSCVLLTGYAGLESARYAINNRLLDRYVCKPIEDPKEFSEVVVSELERFHLRRSEAIQAAQIRRQSAALHLANERLERMKRIAEHVAYFSRDLRTLDLDEVLDLVCEKAPALFGAKSCFLFVPDRNNKLTLWRERRLNCFAPAPASRDINKVMREALTTRRPAIALCRESCTGSPCEDCDSQGCVLMPLQLSHRDPAFSGDQNALPALLCLCGVEGPTNLSRQDIDYKVLLINDIVGANIANALAHTETDRLAHEDSLTGANTRRVFEDLLSSEWVRFQRYESPFCVAMSDVDDLKGINDSYGHAAGDEVLCKIALIADQRSRLCDAVARYGGDEFCIMLPETDLDGAKVVVQRVKDAIAEATFSFAEVRAKVSIGVASSRGKKAPGDVLAAADRALCESKQGGRNLLSTESLSHRGGTTD